MSPPHEFDAAEVRELFSEIDRRLRAQGVSAAVFVVGGAAMAVSGYRDERLTADVDALASTANEAYLFGTKLLAQRRKDVDDLVAMARRLGHIPADPVLLEAHLRGVYTNHEALKLIVGTRDPDAEIALLAADAARMLNEKAARV